MIQKRETPSKFVQIPKTHIFAVQRTLYTKTDGNEDEQLHYLQKIGSQSAMTMDKGIFVHMSPHDTVYQCTIVKNSVELSEHPKRGSQRA